MPLQPWNEARSWVATPRTVRASWMMGRWRTHGPPSALPRRVKEPVECFAEALWAFDLGGVPTPRRLDQATRDQTPGRSPVGDGNDPVGRPPDDQCRHGDLGEPLDQHLPLSERSQQGGPWATPAAPVSVAELQRSKEQVAEERDGGHEGGQDPECDR